MQSMLMAYALEIAIKSLWAMDNPDKCMRHNHDLLRFYKGLQPDTVTSLQDLGLTGDLLMRFPRPFANNRYSMEYKTPEKYEKELVRVKAVLLKTTWEVAARNTEEAEGRPWMSHTRRLVGAVREPPWIAKNNRPPSSHCERSEAIRRWIVCPAHGELRVYPEPS